MGSTTFPVALLRSRKTGHVLFLEAEKDFVDTLLSFLLLPVGTIIHMLSNGPVEMKHLSGISSIFESVRSLDCSLLHVDKKYLVEPRPAAAGTCGSTGLLQGLKPAMTSNPSKKKVELPKIYYGCRNRSSCMQLSINKGIICHFRRLKDHKTGRRRQVCRYDTIMNVLPEDLEDLQAGIEENEDPDEKASCSTSQGFVMESITYMVSDSLEIMPSTTIRSIKVLNKLKVATLADLESTDIMVSTTQVLQLLQSALTSSSCLNDVFGKK